MATASCSRWRDAEREVYRPCAPWKRSSYAQINDFQDNIAHGRENHWRCRAGARYLYICEDGLVHYCSQQRGYPAKPLTEYTRGGYPARVPDREKLRAALHGGLRAPDFVHGFLARAAEFGAGGGGAAFGTGVGADPVAPGTPKTNSSANERESTRIRPNALSYCRLIRVHSRSFAARSSSLQP